MFSSNLKSKYFSSQQCPWTNCAQDKCLLVHTKPKNATKPIKTPSPKRPVPFPEIQDLEEPDEDFEVEIVREKLRKSVKNAKIKKEEELRRVKDNNENQSVEGTKTEMSTKIRRSITLIAAGEQDIAPKLSTEGKMPPAATESTMANEKEENKSRSTDATIHMTKIRVNNLPPKTVQFDIKHFLGTSWCL